MTREISKQCPVCNRFFRSVAGRRSHQTQTEHFTPQPAPPPPAQTLSAEKPALRFNFEEPAPREDVQPTLDQVFSKEDTDREDKKKAKKERRRKRREARFEAIRSV
jgi:hypothetical protein